MKKTDRILLIQLTAIGDTLMCEPALFGLRSSHPNAHITFLTSNAAAPILENNPSIDRLMVWKKKTPILKYICFLFMLSRDRYDLLVDFQNSPRTYLMAHFIRAKQKVSFESKRRNYIYSNLSRPIDVTKYAAFEKFEICRPYLLGNLQPSEPRIYIQESNRTKAKQIFATLAITPDDVIIAVSPVSKVRYRSWKPENYARLCDYLYVKYKVKFVFTWGPGEKHMVMEVINSMQSHKPCTDYSIDCLKVLYAVFEASDMYLGNNNGPRHLAIAAGIPSMCIFGHFYYSHWTPPNEGKHIYVEPKARNATKGVERIDTVDYMEAQDQCETLLNRVIAQKFSLTNRIS